LGGSLKAEGLGDVYRLRRKDEYQNKSKIPLDNSGGFAGGIGWQRPGHAHL